MGVSVQELQRGERAILPSELKSEHGRRKMLLNKKPGNKLVTKVRTLNMEEGSGTYGPLYD